MSKFMLRYEVNKDRSILHTINFLIAYGIMSFEEARPLSQAFHVNAEDVVVDIPDAFESEFMGAMDAVNLQYERLAGNQESFPSFPCSAWERTPGRSASRIDVAGLLVTGRGLSGLAFPRRAWERGEISCVHIDPAVV